MTIKEYILDAMGKFWTKLKSTYVTNCASTSNNLALAASQGKVLQDQITALNSSLVFPTAGLNNTGKTILEYLDSLQNGCVVHAHAWTRISDMPSTLTTGRMDITFVTDKIERIYDYVIVHKDGAEWYAYPNSNTLGSRSLTWVMQPTRAEVNELNSKTVVSASFNSGNPLTISASSNSAFILYGFVQGVVSGGLFVITVINSEVRIFDIGSNTQVTSVLSGSYSNGTLTISSTNAAASRVVLSRA